LLIDELGGERLTVRARADDNWRRCFICDASKSYRRAGDWLGSPQICRLVPPSTATEHRNIHVRSRRSGERVMASVSQFLTNKLKLKVPSKSGALQVQIWKGLPRNRLHRSLSEAASGGVGPGPRLELPLEAEARRGFAAAA
jgi:hypothetical protein